MAVDSSHPALPAAAAPSPATRFFGRFQLTNLLGKSARTMLWVVHDPRAGQALLLAMPRVRPAHRSALEQWRQSARLAARIDHPGLAPVVEVGEHDQWPFMAYDRGQAVVLTEVLSSKGQPAQEMAPWALQILQGLAFAHEAGLAHADLQPHMILLGEGGARLLGLGVALLPMHGTGQALVAQRKGSERDVLAMGVLMHHALAGQPALDQPDVTEVMARLPPLGREIVRVPWSTAHPIPEALRAIVNRATDRQERQRYRNARTLERALEGWLLAEGAQGGGPLALLLDRIRANGLLPALPGAANRAARLLRMERERNDELAQAVLQDMALTFELMRLINTAQARNVLAAGNGPILAIRRAVDMLGLDAVSRAANALRAWPGPLNEAQAAALELTFERVRRAGRIAQWIRPPGYDGEVVCLLALLQNLGRLVIGYHCADEAAQIERLMRPAPSTDAGQPDDLGMSEEAASFAVLGIDVAGIGVAIGRLWGLDESLLHMIQRPALAQSLRPSASDDELLRLTASCANEIVDVSQTRPAHRAGALQRVAQRYGRLLGLSLQDLQSAAQGIDPASKPAPIQRDALTAQTP